jgi:hypothetical protein
MLGDLANAVTSPIRATGRLVFGDKKLKVGVVGAGGGIGQPLSLLLKLSPFVTELSLFDVADFTPGTPLEYHVGAVAPFVVTSQPSRTICMRHSAPFGDVYQMRSAALIMTLRQQGDVLTASMLVV